MGVSWIELQTIELILAVRSALRDQLKARNQQTLQENIRNSTESCNYVRSEEVSAQPVCKTPRHRKYNTGAKLSFDTQEFIKPTLDSQFKNITECNHYIKIGEIKIWISWQKNKESVPAKRETQPTGWSRKAQ